jgi:nucleoid-associated protein YgaU
MDASGGRSVAGELGQAKPQITDGFGGTQTVDRTERVGLTWWSGRNPAAVTFAIRFDNRATYASVETLVHTLEALAGVGLGDDEETPDILFNANGMVPLDQSDPRAAGWAWKISAAPDPQEEERDDSTGARFLGEYNLTLTRSVADASLQARSDAEARRIKQRTSKSGPKTRTYAVKVGDTLVSIATREYGDVDRWTDIAKANNLHDPRAPLRVGSILRLPK